MPICWKMLAAARNVPQQMPPMSVFLLYALCCSSPGPVILSPGPVTSPLEPEILSPGPVILSPANLFFSAGAVTTETAPTATAASAIRAALNVIGSMLSMPVRWKTKAVPQIMAVSMSKALPNIFLSFIQTLRDQWNCSCAHQQI